MKHSIKELREIISPMSDKERRNLTRWIVGRVIVGDASKIATADEISLFIWIDRRVRSLLQYDCGYSLEEIESILNDETVYHKIFIMWVWMDFLLNFQCEGIVYIIAIAKILQKADYEVKFCRDIIYYYLRNYLQEETSNIKKYIDELNKLGFGYDVMELDEAAKRGEILEEQRWPWNQ